MLSYGRKRHRLHRGHHQKKYKMMLVSALLRQFGCYFGLKHNKTENQKNYILVSDSM
jgi:hypothetical protein